MNVDRPYPAMNNNMFFVIVQFDTKDVDYRLKRLRVAQFVRKRRGVRLSPGVYVFDMNTQRHQMVDDFVKAGMLDEGDRVICIEAANWTTYPDAIPRRPSQPQFPFEPEEQRNQGPYGR